MTIRLLVLAALLVLPPTRSDAGTPPTCNLIKIREVYPDASASYVMLQMFASNQNGVAGASVDVFDAAGTLAQSLSFPADVANGLNQSTVLIGTSNVATAFGVAPDLVAAVSLPASGGKVCWNCFGYVDCMAWGNYGGNTAGLCNFDQPPDCSLAAPGGIPSTKALRRRIDGNNPALLDAIGDDTDVSADDFEVVDPFPFNNGTIPTTTTTTTNTNTTGTGVTTTNPGGSTTTSTLGCAPAGIDGARCVLADLPPSDCVSDEVPQRIPRLASAARGLLDRAEQTTRERRRIKLVKRSAAKLATASTASARAGDKQKISPDCVAALRAVFDGARARLTAILPASSAKDGVPR
jgi:hypothetical protein